MADPKTLTESSTEAQPEDPASASQPIAWRIYDRNCTRPTDLRLRSAPRWSQIHIFPPALDGLSPDDLV